MSNVPYVIKNTVLEDVQCQFSIPGPLIKLVDFVESSNLFLYYRTYRLTTYVNPGHAVITGGVLHSGAKFLGISSYVKVALYIKCAFDLLERYRHLHEACLQFKEAAQFKYPVYRPMNWDFTENAISPGLAIWWNITARKYIEQTWKVIVCAAIVLWEAFKTGIFLRDLYLLTKGDGTIEFYAYTDLAENLGRYGDELEKNAALLVEKLKSAESLGNRLLTKLEGTGTIAGIVEAVIAEFPKVFTGLIHIDVAKENTRSLTDRYEISWSKGMDRPSKLPLCRYIPYCGQQGIDFHFQNGRYGKISAECAAGNSSKMQMPGVNSLTVVEEPTNLIHNFSSLVKLAIRSLSDPFSLKQ